MADRVALIDYGAGNLHSVHNALKAAGAGNVAVTDDPATVRAADRIVLPGVGAFAACMNGLSAIPGMIDALEDRVQGDKGGIVRYGHAYSPMDETLSRVAVDISGRPYFVWKAGFTQPRLGEMDTELFEHWFHSIAQTAGLTLHIELLYGANNHHICESIYKGFARAMRAAVEIDPRKQGAVPSTKGILGG